jgi:transcriptional antiterminator RfaH
VIVQKIEAQQPVAEKRVWIVVNSRPHQEIVAMRELRNQGFEVYLPLRQYVNRKKVLVAAAFLPSYLFVHVTPYPQDWREIFSTRGVNGVLGCTPSRACGVQDRVVQRIRDQEEGGYIKMGLAEDQAPQRYAPGDRVKVAMGQHADVDALFLEHVDAKRALILVSLLGRDSNVRVDLRQIASA